MDTTSVPSTFSTSDLTSDDLHVLRLCSFNFESTLQATEEDSGLSDSSDMEENHPQAHLPPPPSPQPLLSYPSASEHSSQEIQIGMPPTAKKRTLAVGKALHQRKRKTRHRDLEKHVIPQVNIRRKMIERHAQLKIHQVDVNALKLPHSGNAYIGTSPKDSQTTEETLENLRSNGYEYVSAEGQVNRYAYISLK
jgi:hypothetical protein